MSLPLGHESWLRGAELVFCWVAGLDLCTNRGFVGCGGGLRAHREDQVGAIAVQIVWSSRRGSRSIEHLGSAHDEAGLAALKAAAGRRLAAGQAELDLGVGGRPDSEPLPITSSRAAQLWGALCRAYDVLGFD